MAENKLQMPGVFGGLMRYDSEYKSRFMFSPTTIVAFLILIILFVLVLKIFWPVSAFFIFIKRRDFDKGIMGYIRCLR